jgi:hypothetical protein
VPSPWRKRAVGSDETDSSLVPKLGPGRPVGRSAAGRPPRPGRYTLLNLPPDLFSRKGLCDRLGVPEGHITEKAVRQLEYRGVFRPVARTTNNNALYNEACVEAALEFLREEEGRKNRPPEHFNEKTFTTEHSLAVYAGLAAGKSMIQIALEHKIDPRFVEVITDKYRKQQIANGAIILDPDDLKKLNAKLAPARTVFDEDGKAIKPAPIETATELLEELTTLVAKIARQKVCIRCRKEARSEECECCIVKKIQRELERLQRASETPATSQGSVPGETQQPAPASSPVPSDEPDELEEQAPSSNAAE